MPLLAVLIIVSLTFYKEIQGLPDPSKYRPTLPRQKLPQSLGDSAAGTKAALTPPHPE
jgi:hypothetical protein